MTRFLLAAFGAVVLSGCGAFGGSSFCDFRQGSSNGPEPRCQERVNTISAEVFKGACTAAGGIPSSGTCPREGVVAGCFIGTQGDGSKVNGLKFTDRRNGESHTVELAGVFVQIGLVPNTEVLKFVRDDDEAEGVLRPQKARPK